MLITFYLFYLLLTSFWQSYALLPQNLFDLYEVFNGQKCFKLINSEDTYEKAIEKCKSIPNTAATLVSIHSDIEQEFLVNFLSRRTNSSAKVWIGAKRDAETYVWEDGSKFDFENWRDNDGQECAAMSAADGKWTPALCRNKNLILCQFSQNCSLSQLFLELQTMTENLLSQKIGDLNELAKNVTKQMFPVGFIYVQLPYQSDPNKLWKDLKWTDVSSEYAGHFFRVLGGKSATFEKSQDEDSPRLESIDWHYGAEGIAYDSPVEIPPNGEWSKYIYTAGHTGDYDFLRFKLSSTEVRPRNYAIKLWKREE